MNKTVIYLIVAIIVVVTLVLIFNASKQSVTTVPQMQSPQPAQTDSTPPSASPAVSQNVITLSSDGFSPATITVRAGDTVTWINKSGSDATVNSAPHPVHTDYPPLNLGTFPDGGTLSLTFPTAGSYKYHNHLNPSQTGTIVVQ